MKKDPTVSLNDPKMLELLKKINILKEEIAQIDDENDKAALKRELSNTQMHYNILSERKGLG